MNAEASGLESSYYGDDDIVQDAPQGVIEETSEPHALHMLSKLSHPLKIWLRLHQGSTYDADDALTYTEAMTWPDSTEYLGAMHSEIQYMYDNQV
jgi:hypothetical protein